MTTAKNEVFVGLKLEKFYLEGGGESTGGDFSRWGVRMSKFLVGGGRPHLPSVGKT